MSDIPHRELVEARVRP